MENRRFNRKPPVQEGDVLQVTIESIGTKGDGIARKDGYIIFVPEVSQHDQVTVKITKALSKVGFGQVITEGEEQPKQEAEQEESESVQEPSEQPQQEPDEQDLEEAKKE